MKVTTAVLALALLVKAESDVDVYSAQSLHALSNKLLEKHTRSATQDLERYGNHYTLLAVRGGTGSAELHEHEADLFFVVSGEATLVSGGKILNSRTVKAGEIRGASIQGGERHPLQPGDVVHIPARMPHQLVIENGKTFTYFVAKVTGQ